MKETNKIRGRPRLDTHGQRRRVFILFGTEREEAEIRAALILIRARDTATAANSETLKENHNKMTKTEDGNLPRQNDRTNLDGSMGVGAAMQTKRGSSTLARTFLGTLPGHRPLSS